MPLFCVSAKSLLLHPRFYLPCRYSAKVADPAGPPYTPIVMYDFAQHI